MGMLDLFRRATPALTAAAVPHRSKTLTAAAQQVTPEAGQALAKRNRGRAWQDSAFVYRRAIPEVGYVIRFLSNNSAHIRLFAGDRPRGADEVLELDDGYGWIEGESGTAVRDPDALPEDLVDAARDAMSILTGSSPSGGGAAILAPLVANFELVGEAWLVGEYDPEADRESWGIYSRSEVQFRDGRLPTMDADGPSGYYRIVTGEGKDAEARDLDPAYTTVFRMWTADTQWSGEPDSPMRSLAGVCERLLLIERATDAALRSRAAGNGWILIPDEMSPPSSSDEEADEEADEFQQDITRQLVTPLAQDGSAASVAPGVLRGPGEYLDKVRHLTVERALDAKLADMEARNLTRLGIGLDVPPEVITGYADVNHWNVWQVSSDTFKHHQEPITINGVEALTVAYLRARLTAAGRWEQDLIDRVVMWYDPASLIVPPDQRDAANDAYDRGTISGKAHRRILGFDEGDAPEEAQQARDEAVGTTGMSAELLAQVALIAKELITGAGFDPVSVTQALGLKGLAHSGVIPSAQPALPPGSPTPPAEEPPGTDTPPDGEEPPTGVTAAAPAGESVTAKSRRLSRRLAAIDRALRERLQAAADAALARALERAGNRVRSRTNGNAEARAVVAGLPGEQVPAALGRAVVASLGMEESELLAEAFDRFRAQYTEWTVAAAEEAIDTAAELAGLPRTDPSVMRAVAGLRDRFVEGVELSWPALEGNLLSIAEGSLYEPDANAPSYGDTPGEVPVTRVPPGPLREALAVAGGLAADATGRPPLSGVTSGQLLTAFLRDSGTQPVEYEWSYGISARPFKPHRDLDGVVFRDWDDPALRTPPEASWIGTSMAPGDHKGCHCDFSIIWSDGGRARAEQEAVGRRAYEEQKPGRRVPGADATVDERRFDPNREAVPPLRPSPAAQAARAVREAAPAAAAEAAAEAAVTSTAANAEAARRADLARRRAEVMQGTLRAAEETARKRPDDAQARATALRAELAARAAENLAEAAEKWARDGRPGTPLVVSRTVTGNKSHLVEVTEDGQLGRSSLCNSETPPNVQRALDDDPDVPTCKRCQASAEKRDREAAAQPQPGQAAAPQGRKVATVSESVAEELRYLRSVEEDEGNDPGFDVTARGEVLVTDPAAARYALTFAKESYEGYIDDAKRYGAADPDELKKRRAGLRAVKSLLAKIDTES